MCFLLLHLFSLFLVVLGGFVNLLCILRYRSEKSFLLNPLSFGYDFRLEICVLLAFIFSLRTLGNIKGFGYWLGIAMKQINCHVTFSVVVGLFLGVVGVVAHVTYRFLCRFCADVDVRGGLEVSSYWVSRVRCTIPWTRKTLIRPQNSFSTAAHLKRSLGHRARSLCGILFNLCTAEFNLIFGRILHPNQWFPTT